MGRIANIGVFLFASVAAATAASAEPVAPPPLIQIVPLEDPAETDEIIQAVDACMQAVGPNHLLNLKRLTELGWRTGASKQMAGGEVVTQYLRRNIVNDVAALPRAVSCTTKAKLNGLAQVAEIRAAMITKYGLSRFDDFSGKETLKRAMLARFGDGIRDTILFREGNTFTIEITKLSFGDFVAITNAPDVTNVTQAAH